VIDELRVARPGMRSEGPLKLVFDLIDRERRWGAASLAAQKRPPASAGGLSGGSGNAFGLRRNKLVKESWPFFVKKSAPAATYIEEHPEGAAHFFVLSLMEKL
jgi:hypothetical protein